MEGRRCTWAELREVLKEPPPVEESTGLPFTVYWRGQRKPSWSLQSAFDRLAEARLEGARDREAEVHRLRALRERLHDRFRNQVVGSTDIRLRELAAHPQELWAIGRHYGLITPFLDWTEVPYIGVYFAIRDLWDRLRRPSGEIPLPADAELAVFRLVCRPGLLDEGLSIERPRIEGLGRLIAQRAAFSLLSGDFEHLSIESYLESRGKAEHLTKYVLAGREEIKAASAEITAAGIDWRTLYPDEHGAALAVNALVEFVTDAP